MSNLNNNLKINKDGMKWVDAQAGICPTGCEEGRRKEAAGLPGIPVSELGNEQFQERKDRPGPKCSKVQKEEKFRSRSSTRTTDGRRMGLRSRDSSASSTISVSSGKSAASSATEANRKARRDAELTARRTMDGKKSGPSNEWYGNKQEVEEVSDVEEYHPDSDQEMVDEEEFVEVEKKGKVTGESRKRGRPPTSGDYVDLAIKKQAVISLRKEEQELDMYEKMKDLSSEDLYLSMKLDLETAVEDLKMNPTPDVASRARESLDSVLKVTKISKNLKGGCVKILKQAAVLSTAAVEVLRTRADDRLDKMNADVSRQMRNLREELEKARKEARESQEEMKKMRLELEEMRKSMAGKKRSRRIRDTPSPEPVSKEGKKREEIFPVGKEAWKEPLQQDTTVIAMETDEPEDTTTLAMETDEPEDTKIKKVSGRDILPPPEKWPPAIRPAIQGKVKIIEDCVLVDKVRIVGKKEVGKGAKEKGREPESGSKQGELRALMDGLAPMLEGWLEKRLGTTHTKTEQKSLSIRKEDKGPQGKGIPQQNQGVPKKSATREREEERWTSVLGRKEKKGVRKEKGKEEPRKEEDRRTEQRKAQPVKAQSRGDAIQTKEGQKKARKRRPPRRAAVTLTCPPGKYADAMRKARKDINLEELGIQGLKTKRAVTGALILEVLGPNGKEKAAILRDRMEEALVEMEGVKVARPTKMADLRIRDVDDSAELEEIREAVAKKGGCSPSEVKVGDKRMATNGLGMIWAQCPVEAANKVADTGKLRIGWVMARVELLEPRRLQCFKCMEFGHVQGQCRSGKDRRNDCYRCGKPGHVARDCVEEAHCVLCQEAGRSPRHRMGGPACAAATSRRGGGNNRPAVRGGGPTRGDPPVPVRSEKGREEEVERMEVEVVHPTQPLLEQKPERGGTGQEESAKPQRSRLL